MICVLLLILLPIRAPMKHSSLVQTRLSQTCVVFFYSRKQMADVDREDASLDTRVIVTGENSEDSKQHFSEDEETLITLMFKLVGERWSLIAGRIPGRTAEEIEKYWTSRYSTSEGKKGNIENENQ